MNRNWLAAILFVLPMALTFFGIYTLVSSLYLIYMGSAAVRWPKTAGTVTKTRIVDGFGKYNTKCKVKIEYTFTANGNLFVGDTLQFGQPPRTRIDAQNIEAKYPLGSFVEVAYHPNDAKLSVVKPGVADTLPLFALFGGVFATAGIVGCRLCYNNWQTIE